jgi:predicted cobalt transporter CbtA
MTTHRVTAGTPRSTEEGQSTGRSGQPPDSSESLSGLEPAAPAPEASAGPEAPNGGGDEAETLNRLSKILLAVVPALTVALAAVGSATGGLARMFRDQTGAARASIGLIFLAFALAGSARLPATAPGSSAARMFRRQRLRALVLLASGLALVIGIAGAFNAQIVVMGNAQAPVVTGSITPTSSGDSLDAHVLATGVKSSNRIVVFAFESSDPYGDTDSIKVPLYYSKSGPDPDGKVDVHVTAQVPTSDLQTFPYLFVTAVLGEQQRDCDGVPIEGTKSTAPAPDETACLTLQRPGAPPPADTPSASSASAAPSALSSPTPVDVPGTVGWTRTGLTLTQGQRFVVHATGQVSFIQTAPSVGPDGATDEHPGVCVLPGPDHHAALIGRILGPSPGAPFLVGSTFDGQANQSGELELGINDTGVENNGGAFQTSVQLATT